MDIIVEAIGAFEEQHRIDPCAQTRREVRHYERLHREILGLKRNHIQPDGSPFVSRYTLLNKMVIFLIITPL